VRTTAGLSIALLGSFQVVLNSAPVSTFRSDKVRALLAYLAVEADRPHRRVSLAALLWPDQPEHVALQNLRQSLVRLRHAIDNQGASAPFLLITPTTIQFNHASDYWLDAAAFVSLIDACQHHRHDDPPPCSQCMEWLYHAAHLYRGDFMAGFSLDQSTPFQEWLLLERERFHRQAIHVFSRLAGHHEQRGEHAQVCAWAQAQLALEPWREEAHRQLMRALALSGQRAAALVQYDACRRILYDELGVAPADETTQLCVQIRAGKLERRSDLEHAPASLAPARARRQLTVLSCALVDLLALSECGDPEEVYEVVRAIHQFCTSLAGQFGGQTTQVRGGEWLVSFGYPLAHDDDAVQAVRAGLAIVEELDRDPPPLVCMRAIPLALHVGVHTGVVVVGDTEDTGQRDVELVGLTPTVAAVVRGMAAPNTVAISAATYQLVQDVFECRMLGTCMLEGRESLVVYQIQRATRL